VGERCEQGRCRSEGTKVALSHSSSIAEKLPESDVDSNLDDSIFRHWQRPLRTSNRNLVVFSL
jgi:hypothetical protein